MAFEFSFWIIFLIPKSEKTFLVLNIFGDDLFKYLMAHIFQSVIREDNIELVAIIGKEVQFPFLSN